MQCLICVNIQDNFINNIENSDEIIPIVNELLKKFRLVIFTLENEQESILYDIINKNIKIENI